MNSKNTLILSFFGLLVLLFGAFFLYGRLDSTENAPQLAVSTVAQETSTPSETSPTVTAPAATAPDFTVYDAQGDPIRLSDFQGKPVVVNFWASWCGPCQMELPDFQGKYEELGDSVQFLMVNLTDGVQETVDTVAAFIAKEGYTLPVYYDTGRSAAYAYGVNAIPCTYFINAQGNAIAQASGAIDAESLQQGIDPILPDL